MITKLQIAIANAERQLANAADDGEWERLEAVRVATDARSRRERNLDRASDLRLTGRMRAALVAGEGLQETGSLATVRDWLTLRAQPCLVLSGSTGCGKSLAAAYAIASEGGLWARAEKLARIFTANFGEQYEAQDAVRDGSFVVLDDIGSEFDAQRMAALLIEVLDYRKDTRQRTIITTNLTLSAFKLRYGNERLMSRLAELAQVYGDSGADLRRVT